jgi:hypothetical protein
LAQLTTFFAVFFFAPAIAPRTACLATPPNPATSLGYGASGVLQAKHYAVLGAIVRIYFFSPD